MTNPDSDGLAQLLLNSTGEGIYGVDMQGNCTFANPACVRLLGFDGDGDLLGRNMHELVHHTRPNGDPYPMEECRIYRAFREGKGVHVEDEVMWSRDGSSFPAEYWSYPMEREGELIGCVLTFVDITERKQLEVKLRVEHDRAERLLLNVLPAAIAQQLKERPGRTIAQQLKERPGRTIAQQLKERPGRTIAQQFDDVSVLFADLVGFTPLSARLGPELAVDLLNEIFTAFDHLADRHGVEKIKTLGDGYMAVAGAPLPLPDHCAAIADVALGMRSWMAHQAAREGLSLQLRIGINRGPAVGAIIGTTKFMYDLWGDTGNVAARMESHGEPGRIQVTESVQEHLSEGYVLEPRGLIEVKGKGKLNTWFLESTAE